jgi:hypothetical protein
MKPMKPQLFLSIALFIFAAFPMASTALAQAEPTIAPEIGRLIAEEGIDAAKARFDEMAKSDSLDFGTEISGLHALLGAYMQAGNNEAAEAVGEMTGQLTQSMMFSMPGMGAQMEQMQKADQAAKEQARRERDEEQKLAQKKLEKSRGKSREDLDRFTGLYGEKGSNDMGKTIFVMPSCDGYLVTGPMWADVGPWWMRSASEMVFTYADSFQNFSMEFELDESDGIHVMKHELEGIRSPLEWKKELPREYGQCVERRGR